MTERLYNVIARADVSGAGDVYYRGPGRGLFNRSAEWVGALRQDEARRMTLADAEAFVRVNAAAMAPRRLVIRNA